MALAAALAGGAGVVFMPAAPARAESVDIGNATKVVNVVLGTDAEARKQRRLEPGGVVRLNEVINTKLDSASTFLFRDNTELSIGANSQVVLDRFVYNPASGRASMTLSLTKGVFRFATGSMAKTAYKIRTPTATIGVRGTVFEVLVKENGETTVWVDEGKVLMQAGSRETAIDAGYFSFVPPGRGPAPPARAVIIPPTVMKMNTLLTQVAPVPPTPPATAKAGPPAAAGAPGGPGGPAASVKVKPPVVTTRAAALAGALSGTPEGLRLLQAWLDAANGQPAGVAARAIELIKALRGGYAKEIDVAQSAADRISQAAAAALDASYIVRGTVAPKFELSGARLGFDFGSSEAPLMGNFSYVGPKDERLGGKDIQTFMRAKGLPLMGDGLAQVTRFTTKLRDGRYRIILWTNDSAGPGYLQTPFGQVIVVNGVAYRIAGNRPETWLPQVTLGEARDAAAGQGLGGALVLVVDVKGGILELGFGDGVEPTFLAGIIVEPADLPSILSAWGPAAGVLEAHSPGSAQRLNALSAIDDAVGELLGAFATAAGPGAVPNFNSFALPQPVALPTDVPSPS